MSKSRIKNLAFVNHPTRVYYKNTLIGNEFLNFHSYFYNYNTKYKNDISLAMRESKIVIPAYLSSREKKILIFTAEGYTSLEISVLMYISIHTVNFHIKNTLKKFNAKNKTQAVAAAIIFGLI